MSHNRYVSLERPIYSYCSIECLKLCWFLNNYALALDPYKQSECTQHLLVEKSCKHIEGDLYNEAIHKLII